LLQTAAAGNFAGKQSGLIISFLPKLFPFAAKGERLTVDRPLNCQDAFEVVNLMLQQFGEVAFNGYGFIFSISRKIFNFDFLRPFDLDQ
jgi:hypothetical protein